MNILNENRTLGENARHKGWCQCRLPLVHTEGRWARSASAFSGCSPQRTPALTLDSLVTDYWWPKKYIKQQCNCTALGSARPRATFPSRNRYMCIHVNLCVCVCVAVEAKNVVLWQNKGRVKKFLIKVLSHVIKGTLISEETHTWDKPEYGPPWRRKAKGLENNLKTEI